MQSTDEKGSKALSSLGDGLELRSPVENRNFGRNSHTGKHSGFSLVDLVGQLAAAVAMPPAVVLDADWATIVNLEVAASTLEHLMAHV